MSSQMVLKQQIADMYDTFGFRSMSSQMVLKQVELCCYQDSVLDLCHLKWY